MANLNVNVILILFCVFALGAASGYFSERVGIVNIGINGMMIFGAIMYSVFASFFVDASGTPQSSLFLIPILMAGIVTIIIGLLFGISTIWLKADHVVAGTAINLLGGAIGVLFTNELGKRLYAKTNLINPFTYGVWGNAGVIGVATLVLFLIVAIVLIALMVIFKYTKFGLRYKSIGENPNAADSQGINVTRYQWIGICLSALVAGLAGAIFMYQQENKPFYGDVDGLGYMSLAIMITGSWRLPLITIVSLGFGVLYTLGQSGSGDYVVQMVPYIVTLGFLIIFSKWMRGPKFAGQHFDKSRR